MEDGSVTIAPQDSNVNPISGDSGVTVEKVVTPSDGRGIWSDAKSLMGKSFEMSVGHIVLAVGIVALVAGVLGGIKIQQSRVDQINWAGKKWFMVGLVQDNINHIYIPVYKDEDQLRKEGVHL